MVTKKKVLQIIKKLPDNFSIDEVVDRLIVLEKIEKGLEQSEAGKVMSTAMAKSKLEKWL